MTVSEFKNKHGERFDNRFVDVLPEVCSIDGCDGQMELSEVLTGLHCNNPKCPGKMAGRVLSLLNTLRVRSVTEHVALRIVQERNITNPFMLFTYDPTEGALCEGFSIGKSSLVAEQLQMYRQMSLSRYLQLACLPYIRESAFALSNGYQSLADLYADIEQGGLGFIADRLGIPVEGDTVSYRVVRVYDVLMQYKDDLMQGLAYVELTENM